MRRMAWMLAGLGLLAMGSARAAEPLPEMGKQVAQRWCANCHVIGPEQSSGSDQVPSFRAIAKKPETTADTLHAFLAIPHGRMPPQALSNADLDAVVAYILSLRR